MDPSRDRILRQLGARVRELRAVRKFSQTQLSRKTGLHPTYLSGIERGTRNPTVVILARLADALHVPLSALFI